MTTPQNFALVGHPVGHSLSPIIHQAAYAALDLSHRYRLIDAPDETSVRRAFDALRRGELFGLNVTVPWKRLALQLADRRDELALQVGAANVLARDVDGKLMAYNTDVLALSEELASHVLGPRTAVVIGSGGAALAAVVALKSLGARTIAVTARGFQNGALPASWPYADQFCALGARVLPWPIGAGGEVGQGDWDQYVSASQVIVQATSAGMHGADAGDVVARIVPWSRLEPSTFAYDVVYNPPITAFLARARAAGLDSQGGLGMLVGQAAHAIRLWLTTEPPVAAMAEAAERALRGKATS